VRFLATAGAAATTFQVPRPTTGKPTEVGDTLVLLHGGNQDRAGAPRGARLRLAVIRQAQEVTHDVSKTFRDYGTSCTCCYRGLERYNAVGDAELREQRRGPHHGPLATSDEVVAKILDLRQHYHFGPDTISKYLVRCHKISISGTGVWRILNKAGLDRLTRTQSHKPHAKCWQCYEIPQPGHQVQIDVMFVVPLPGVTKKRYCRYTAIDDCIRLRILKIFERNSARSAIQFVDYVGEHFPTASIGSRPTVVLSSRRISTGTSSTRASATSTSIPELLVLTARSKGAAALTGRSSASCCAVS
jgi:transposase